MLIDLCQRQAPALLTQEVLLKEGAVKFYPQTIAEAGFIQKKLFELGQTWGGAEDKPLYLEKCVDNGLLVSGGKLYYSMTEWDNFKSPLCSSASFDEPFDANVVVINQTAKITAEFCKHHVLRFYPKTEEESEQIQLKLFELGVGWPQGGQNVFKNPSIMTVGLIVDEDNDVLVNTKNLKTGIECTLADFGGTRFIDKSNIRDLTSDKDIIALFNKAAEDNRALVLENQALKQQLKAVPKVKF